MRTAMNSIGILLCCLLQFPASASDLPLPLDKIPLTGCLEFNPQSNVCTKPVKIQPSPLSWDEAMKRVGHDTRIHHPTEKQLRYKTGTVFQKEVNTVDLAAQVPKWLAMRFDTPDFHAPTPWMASVGNMLEEFSKARKNAPAQEKLLRQLQEEAPEVWAQVNSFLPEWVRDDYLYAKDWTPQNTGRPKGKGNDGILERPPFLLPGSGSGVGTSGEQPGTGGKVFQACAPIYASLEDILTAEDDFENYHKQAGANYLEVLPLDGTAFTGTDPGGNPFLLFDVSFHQKPLPLWNLRFSLLQFLHPEDSRWQMENHVLQGDMNQLRLRIFYDPIRNLDGKVIGFVKTEWLDVDIKGVPEGDSDRMAGVRGDVGNIKRAAEKAL